MRKKSTISDVAKHAGVSRTTVSYVLNGVNKMSESTKEKVLQAIKELNYQPDFTAVSLSKRKSNIIGVIIPSHHGSLAPILKEDLSYAEFIGGIEYIARKQGYDLLISGTKNTEECIQWIKKRHMDGLIISGLVPDNLHKALESLGIPAALVDNYEEHGELYPNIRIEDEFGGYLAGKHLLDQGHTCICYVGHDFSNILVDANRINGLKTALHEANLSLDESLVFEGEGSFLEVGYKMGQKILNLGDKVTAIFASSDVLAIGIMKALKDNGKKIPEDYSIVGFDNLPISKYASPSLTTIKQDVFNKGVISAQMILNMIKLNTTIPQNMSIPTELIVRESTRPLQ